MSPKKPNILFLCTGNSCRSQMAEGWARALKGDELVAYSAGIEKHGLNPRAVQVMQEAGVDISGHQSQTLADIGPVDLDVVVTVCGHAHETCPVLPEEKPRYLMGVGTPLDILHAVQNGVDMFDCVLPTRNARHGVLYTRWGSLRIKNARFRRDSGPVEKGCECPCCRQASRAFLHHLMRQGELTGTVLATLHNLWFFLDFMGQLREAIASGKTAEWAERFERDFAATDRPPLADGS
jgi:tRNA-guanine family transglycosylase